MTTQNATNTSSPITVAQGGTGSATFTAHGILVGEGTSTFSALTLTNGQLLIGSTGADPAQASLTAGTGITITPGAGTITIAATAFLSFVNQTSASATLTNGDQYLTNNGASLVTYTLPATAAVGDMYVIRGFSSGGWTIAQNASQNIQFGNVTTTTGTGGSLSSSNKGDCISLQCAVANTTWIAFDAQGNITYV